MSAEKPDYHDAELMLRVYEMRRESKTREVRDQLNFNFWPKTYEDVVAVQANDNPMNTAWRQLSGYWEMVYSMAKHGIVNADYLIENNREGIFFYAKVQPFLKQMRDAGAPLAFENLEWATTQVDSGKQTFEYIRGIVEKRLESA